MSDAALDPAARPAAPAVEQTPLGPADQVNWTKVFLGFGGMVIGQFMAVLDVQIVAASLSQIQAGIGASADEISWVQTIYLLAEVVMIPLTAYLSKMWGTQKFYVAAVIAFIVSSIATGLSTSIEMMIVTRALQGLAGGAMIPAVFATAMTVFPIERRITANVIVGLIVTLAPTVGPTLGGHLTESLGWRWLFFVNVIPGLLVLFLVGRYADFDTGDPKYAKGIDWLGLGLMTAFLLSMQYVLEEGASESWFADDLILWLTVLSVICGAAFIWRQIAYRQPIVSLAPFQDRNFTLGSLMNFVAGMSLYGGTFVLPLFLAQIRGYSPAQVGTTMLVSGLTMFAAAPIAGRVIRAMDLRIGMIIGFTLIALGLSHGVYVTRDWGFQEFMALQILRGLGSMIAMIAASQMSISTMPIALMKDASGLVNLIRNVGGAMGLAILTTIISHMTAYHYIDLVSGVTSASMQAQEMMNGLTSMMTAGGSLSPEAAGRKAFGGMLHRQALTMAFGDAFRFLTLGCVVAALLALFAAPSKPAAPPSGGGSR
ncbi:MAG: DHA2 family efflux MFS transporter permease subunit [Phenylobacterium sp.]|uniref:DHA2 family efflux MFS transporter permease subunit n=1 Tax=Phenylobacterium sp. TaxID=1871053 RepID=UPI00391999F0